MKSILLVVFLISICWAEKKESAVQPRPARAPQGHIQYSDPNGLKVSWKLYSPYTQWRSHLDDPQRNVRTESGTAQPSLRPYQGELIRPVTANVAAPTAAPEKSAQPVHQVQVQYKPYSMVPTHIKQLILEMYEPQVPYIDPAVYIYRPHRQLEEEQQQQQASSSEQQESSAQAVTTLSQLDDAQPQYEHISKFQTNFPYNKSKLSLAQYADDQPAYATTATPQYGAVPEKQNFASEEQESSQEQQQQQQPQKQEDNMPKEIKELLNLQAQIPYHVLANRIVYKPKSMFIPKPFKEDPKSPYKYRTKIYYVKNDENEEQKSKERKEREEPKESSDAQEEFKEQQQQEE